jgi:poly(A) polymerase
MGEPPHLGRNSGNDRQSIAATDVVVIAHGPGVDAILAAIPGARFVGGCVRDALAGQAAKDIDLATAFTPHEVVERLENAGIKAVPTGIDHGTVTAIAGPEHVEITTLRRDVATDGRRATIAFTADWLEDAARRDFTINALYADPTTGEVYDPFGGVADLKDGVVRFIGAPLDRIAEDHLRILRFFRFYARFGKGAPDKESIAACTARANDLMALSRERIAMEVLSILALPDPAPVITLMIDVGIFLPVLPEISGAVALTQLIGREADACIAPDPIRRLAALLPLRADTAETVASRLKLSNAQKKRLILARSPRPDHAQSAQACAYWLGVEAARDHLLLAGEDVNALQDWMPPALPISGGAIVARGIKAGPEVARILKAVEQQWVDEGFPDQTRVNAIVDRLTQ